MTKEQKINAFKSGAFLTPVVPMYGINGKGVNSEKKAKPEQLGYYDPIKGMSDFFESTTKKGRK